MHHFTLLLLASCKHFSPAASFALSLKLELSWRFYIRLREWNCFLCSLKKVEPILLSSCQFVLIPQFAYSLGIAQGLLVMFIQIDWPRDNREMFLYNEQNRTTDSAKIDVTSVYWANILIVFVLLSQENRTHFCLFLPCWLVGGRRCSVSVFPSLLPFNHFTVHNTSCCREVLVRPVCWQRFVLRARGWNSRNWFFLEKCHSLFSYDGCYDRNVLTGFYTTHRSFTGLDCKDKTSRHRWVLLLLQSVCLSFNSLIQYSSSVHFSMVGLTMFWFD